MSFDFKRDPFENFVELYGEAQKRGIPDAHAMSLATVSSENQPSVRIVYFKGFFGEHSERGFCFYTNYQGRKAADMEFNAKAAANFFWTQMDMQVRLEGIVQKLPREESEKYFASRPRASQLGAWASDQSLRIDSYDDLMAKFARIEAEYAGKAVPCPPHWGGYALVPHEVEFWFGKTGRLHERYVYQKNMVQWDRFMRSP